MSSENLFIALGKLSDDLVAEAAITASTRKNTTRVFGWKSIVAACLVICIIASVVQYMGHLPIENPLVIKAHAVSVDGQPYTAQLSLGERIQLIETEFFFEGDNKYYAFDLTLVDGMYLQLSAVNDQWNVILDKSIHYSGEETTLPYWALTEGYEIATVSTDAEGNVLEAYVNGSVQPQMKGRSMIWRVNTDDMNRCIIDCFNKDFERVASYHLVIVQINDSYYAEIVNIA